MYGGLQQAISLAVSNVWHILELKIIGLKALVDVASRVRKQESASESHISYIVIPLLFR
jgi:hypothetical protein